MSIPEVLRRLNGKLIVSCQASDGDAFRQPESMARFAQAARDGGAAGIRACGVEDVVAIRRAVGLPVIGIQKKLWSDGRVLITGDFEGARALAAAGAEMIALDVTARGQRFGALERLARIKRELNVVVLADIATEEEAVEAARAGADAVLSTMRGYTDETAHAASFQPEFIAALVRAVDVPVIAEGRIATPAEASAAMRSGAWSVIVGTAITRPADLTRGFAGAVEGVPHPLPSQTVTGQQSPQDAQEGAVQTKEPQNTAEVSEAKRLRELEDEVQRLQSMVAGLRLDKETLEAVIRKNGWSL